MAYAVSRSSVVHKVAERLGRHDGPGAEQTWLMQEPLKPQEERRNHGVVFKNTATNPLPAGTKILVRKGQPLDKWLDASRNAGRPLLTVGKDGTDRIVVTAKTYTAKYRDGSRVVREVATGYRTEAAPLDPDGLGTAGRSGARKDSSPPPTMR